MSPASPALAGGFFTIRATWEAPVPVGLLSNHLPKAPPLKARILRIRFQHMNLVGGGSSFTYNNDIREGGRCL